MSQSPKLSLWQRIKQLLNISAVQAVIDDIKAAKDLELDLEYDVQEDLFNTKNAWFKTKVFMTTEPDFFDNMVSGYASDDEDINLDNFEF